MDRQGPAYLIIDALDAAKTAPAQGTLQSLIEQVTALRGRWRVVLTIRKWDFRYNQTLRTFFRGAAIDRGYCDLEFASARHLSVRVLDKRELDQVRAESPGLAVLIDGSTQSLGRLLRLPFNLRLLAELVESGLTVAQLTPIRTQIELLERYWLVRVIGSDQDFDAAEILLRRMVQHMTQSRSLEYTRRLVSGHCRCPGIEEASQRERPDGIRYSFERES